MKFQDELDVEFHNIVNVHEEYWDPSIQNVHPEAMTEASIEVLERYPNKRLIFHYNQPHGPKLGATAQDSVIGPTRPQNESIWEFVVYEGRHEFVSDDTYRQATRETFEIAQPHVKRLLDRLSGKTVITSDHGQLMGERARPIPVRWHGHHIGCYHDAMVTIPWLVHTAGERRKIVSETNTANPQSVSPGPVNERLRDLGYVQ